MSNNLAAKKSGFLCWKYSWEWKVYWPVVRKRRWKEHNDEEFWEMAVIYKTEPVIKTPLKGVKRLLCAKYQNCIQLQLIGKSSLHYESFVCPIYRFDIWWNLSVVICFEISEPWRVLLDINETFHQPFQQHKMED